ncbi:hypothetical protein PR048_026993 [Dryococelus australis]|uniref:Uncharacterized protein n=1 Tax=Dryococelus australis TaxID=614101 RepID=A0ABQ9GMX5_9NEOP|nr:hypothetical protein PR048_026993 [Dryococelus australis]
MPLVGGFSMGSPTFHALSFRRCSILTSITLIGSQDLTESYLAAAVSVRLSAQWPWGRGGRAISLLASQKGDPDSIPRRVTPDFRTWESCRTIPFAGAFSRGSLAFSVLSIPALLRTHLNHPHRLSRPRC